MNQIFQRNVDRAHRQQVSFCIACIYESSRIYRQWKHRVLNIIINSRCTLKILNYAKQVKRRHTYKNHYTCCCSLMAERFVAVVIAQRALIAIYLGILVSLWCLRCTCSFISVKCAYSGFVCKSRSRVSYFVYAQIIAQVHHKHIKLCIVFIYKHTVRTALWFYMKLFASLPLFNGKIAKRYKYI